MEGDGSRSALARGSADENAGYEQKRSGSRMTEGGEVKASVEAQLRSVFCQHGRTAGSSWEAVVGDCTELAGDCLAVREQRGTGSAGRIGRGSWTQRGRAGRIEGWDGAMGKRKRQKPSELRFGVFGVLAFWRSGWRSEEPCFNQSPSKNVKGRAAVPLRGWRPPRGTCVVRVVFGTDGRRRRLQLVRLIAVCDFPDRQTAAIPAPPLDARRRTATRTATAPLSPGFATSSLPDSSRLQLSLADATNGNGPSVQFPECPHLSHRPSPREIAVVLWSVCLVTRLP
jgi:hypothetical protein